MGSRNLTDDDYRRCSAVQDFVRSSRILFRACESEKRSPNSDVARNDGEFEFEICSVVSECVLPPPKLAKLTSSYCCASNFHTSRFDLWFCLIIVSALSSFSCSPRMFNNLGRSEDAMSAETRAITKGDSQKPSVRPTVLEWR